MSLKCDGNLLPFRSDNYDIVNFYSVDDINNMANTANDPKNYSSKYSKKDAKEALEKLDWQKIDDNYSRRIIELAAETLGLKKEEIRSNWNTNDIRIKRMYEIYKTDINYKENDSLNNFVNAFKIGFSTARLEIRDNEDQECPF